MSVQILSLAIGILGLGIGVGSLVCYILVVIQMFKHGQTAPGLISTIGLLACGLGSLFAFIYGWTKAAEWRLKNIMLAWTALIVMGIGIQVIQVIVVMPGAIQAARQAAIKQQEADKAKAEPAPAVP